LSFESSELACCLAGLLNSAWVSCPLFTNAPFSGDNSPSSCDCLSTVLLTLVCVVCSGIIWSCRGRLEDCFSVSVARAAISLAAYIEYLLRKRERREGAELNK